MPRVKLKNGTKVPSKALPPKEQASEPVQDAAPAAPKKKRSSTKKKGPQKLDDHTIIEYEKLNHHELIAMALRADIPNTSMVATREMLIEALQELEPIRAANPMDVTKAKLVKWIQRHWDKFQMQIPKDYEARLNSSDAQVAFFFLKNKDQMT